MCLKSGIRAGLLYEFKLTWSYLIYSYSEIADSHVLMSQYNQYHLIHSEVIEYQLLILLLSGLNTRILFDAENVMQGLMG